MKADYESLLFKLRHLGFGNPEEWREIQDLLKVCTGGEKVSKKEKL